MLADVNVKNKDGMAALIYAVWKGHSEIVKLLIAKGADVNAKDRHGDAALMVAKKKGYTAIINLLQTHGAKE